MMNKRGTMAHSGVYSRYGKSGTENLCGESILTVKEVSKMLKCGTTHVYNMVSSGKLSAFRVGDKKGIRIRESAVHKIMEDQEA
jgi:excisionase family DNA binding protein